MRLDHGDKKRYGLLLNNSDCLEVLGDGLQWEQPQPELAKQPTAGIIGGGGGGGGIFIFLNFIFECIKK